MDGTTIGGRIGCLTQGPFSIFIDTLLSQLFWKPGIATPFTLNLKLHCLRRLRKLLAYYFNLNPGISISMSDLKTWNKITFVRSYLAYSTAWQALSWLERQKPSSRCWRHDPYQSIISYNNIYILYDIIYIYI